MEFWRGTPTIWDWLNRLNAARFAGYSDWRIPTVGLYAGTAELETIVDVSAPGCGSGGPCVPSAFNTACTASCTVTTCSCTQSLNYWSSTTYQGTPAFAWLVNFDDGNVYGVDKSLIFYVRAVRGGS